MATQAEERKKAKYTHLNSAHAFTAVAIDTSVAFRAKTMWFVQELGQRLKQVTAWGGEIHQLSDSGALCGSIYNVESQHRCWAQ